MKYLYTAIAAFLCWDIPQTLQRSAFCNLLSIILKCAGIALALFSPNVNMVWLLKIFLLRLLVIADCKSGAYIYVLLREDKQVPWGWQRENSTHRCLPLKPPLYGSCFVIFNQIARKAGTASMYYSFPQRAFYLARPLPPPSNQNQFRRFFSPRLRCGFAGNSDRRSSADNLRHRCVSRPVPQTL